MTRKWFSFRFNPKHKCKSRDFSRNLTYYNRHNYNGNNRRWDTNILPMPRKIISDKPIGESVFKYGNFSHDKTFLNTIVSILDLGFKFFQNIFKNDYEFLIIYYIK